MDRIRVAKRIFADEIESGTRKYIDFLEKMATEKYRRDLPNLEVPEYGYSKGKRFFKIFRVDSASKSVVAFVDRVSGDIYKPAGWKAPAKHARGNVLDKNSWRGHTDLGPYYLR